LNMLLGLGLGLLNSWRGVLVGRFFWFRSRKK